MIYLTVFCLVFLVIYYYRKAEVLAEIVNKPVYSMEDKLLFMQSHTGRTEDEAREILNHHGWDLDAAISDNENFYF